MNHHHHHHGMPADAMAALLKAAAQVSALTWEESYCVAGSLTNAAAGMVAAASPGRGGTPGGALGTRDVAGLIWITQVTAMAWQNALIGAHADPATSPGDVVTNTHNHDACMAFLGQVLERGRPVIQAVLADAVSTARRLRPVIPDYPPDDQPPTT